MLSRLSYVGGIMLKSFLKKNKIFLLSLLILIVWTIYEIILIFIAKQNNLLFESKDPILYFFVLLNDKFYILQIIFPLFVIVPAVCSFYPNLHTGFIKNCLTRINYKTCFLKFYSGALKSILIIPIFLIILLFLCTIISEGFLFGSDRNIYNLYASAISEYANVYVKFIFVFFLNIFLHSIFYVNLSLICCRRKSNLPISITKSYILFISLEIFIEVLVCGLFFSRFLNIHNTTNLLSLTGAMMYDNVNLNYTIYYSVFLVIISSFVLYFNYKNKERVLIEIEKNY